MDGNSVLLLDFLLLLLLPVLLVLGLIFVFGSFSRLPDLVAWVAGGMGQPAEFWWTMLFALLITNRSVWQAAAKVEELFWRGLFAVANLLTRRS